MEIELTNPQSRMFVSKARIIAVVAGYGSGKTKSLLIKCVHDLIKYRTDLLYLAPTFPLIRDICYPTLIEIFQDMKMHYKINKSEGKIYTPYGNIIVKSMAQPERIVGFQALKAYVDEMDILSISNANKAFHKIAARLRLKPNKEEFREKRGLNQIYIASSPEGYKFMYNSFQKDPVENSELIRMSTYSNPHLPDGYIDGLASQYPEQLRRAYLNGEFVNLTSGRVYYSFNRDDHVLNEKSELRQGEVLFVGQDFNVGKMASTIFVKRMSSESEVVWFALDELVDIRDTPDLIEKLNQRYPKHQKIIYPDATAKNRKTSNISKSDHTMLEQAGFSLRVNKTNPFIKDRVASVNNAFEKGHLFVSSKCKATVESLEQQVYDKDGFPDKENDLDHTADAFGYFVCKEMPVATSIVRYNAIRHL